jgi:hypothetical protein
MASPGILVEMVSSSGFALLLLVAGFQDEALKKALEALRSDDIAERERAVTDLKKTPLGSLHLLEPELQNPDPEVKARMKEIITAALCNSLGKRVERFSAKPVAPRKIMEEWEKTGRDPAKVPTGYERVRVDAALKRDRGGYEYLKEGDFLVESQAVITTEDMESARAKEQMSAPGPNVWVTTFELTLEGAQKFDAAAARLYDQRPNGMLAILVDGVVVMAPVIQSSHFGGHGTISGGKSREECERTARLLKGHWYQVSWKVEGQSPQASSIDEIMKAVRETPGFQEATITKTGERGCTVESTLDARDQDLTTLWQTLRRKGFTIAPLK